MLDDCYFYLYSECKLKERCRYRHNPLSKDNLILCKNWSKNKKCRMDCPLRHSLYHVVKQRSDTMCYWEDKGGCTKYRCEFKHTDASKDDWKEPKVKLLTEIIESKNMHINEASIDKNPDVENIEASIDKNPDVEIIEAPIIRKQDVEIVKGTNLHIVESSIIKNTFNDTVSVDNALNSSNNDVTLSDAQIIANEPSVNNNNEVLSSEIKEAKIVQSLTSKSSDELLINYETTPVNGNAGLFNKNNEDLATIPTDRPSVQTEISNEENSLLKKRKTLSQLQPKKSKTENFDFDIDDLDKEIAEIDELLNDP